jgi:hypothetical protein
VLRGKELENRPLCDCLPVCDQKITPNGRWVYARDLRIDDVVRSHSFGTQKISALELSMTETLMYNFLVDDLHNYAVGENEILVHNTNSPPKSERPQRTGAGKSDPHGDGGRSQISLDLRIDKYKQEIERLKNENVSGRSNMIKDLEQKIKNIEKTAAQAAKGETHWRRGK